MLFCSKRIFLNTALACFMDCSVRIFSRNSRKPTLLFPRIRGRSHPNCLPPVRKNVFTRSSFHQYSQLSHSRASRLRNAECSASLMYSCFKDAQRSNSALISSSFVILALLPFIMVNTILACSSGMTT